MKSSQRQSGPRFSRLASNHLASNHSPSNEWAVVTPAALLRNVFARLPSVVFVTLVVAALVVGVLVAWPNKYVSDGMIYVRLGRAALSIDPTAQNSGSQGVSVQETRSAEVLSVAKMIGSREIAQRVVSKLGADRINEPRSWADRAMLQSQQWFPKKTGNLPGDLTLEQFDSQIQLEEAIERVQAWMKVEAPDNGYTVSVASYGPDALLVQDIVQTVMDEYQNYHVEAHRSSGSLDFFQQQVVSSRQTAIEARERLQQARSETGWMSIESGETTLRERLVNLEISLDTAESSLAEAQERHASLNTKLASTQQWIPTETTKGIPNVAGDAMRSQLYGEQVAESEQLASLKPNHPKYRLLQEKMQRSTEIASDEEKDREQTTEAVNQIWQQLETETNLANASIAGLKSKCKSLQRSLDDARDGLQRLNRDSVTLARLKWEADINEGTLIGHAKSLEEARIIDELDRKNMSDVTVIQNASLNLKKVSPPRALLALIGTMAGLGLGILQAILREGPTNPHPVNTQPNSDRSWDAREEEPSNSMEEFEESDPNHLTDNIENETAVPAAMRGTALPR